MVSFFTHRLFFGIFVILAIISCIVEAVVEDEYYKVLNVSPSATSAEIKKAYRKLAKELHPDRNPGDEAKHRQFEEVADAYAVLSDEDKRQTYDTQGKDGLDPSKQQGGGGFGGGFGGFDPFRQNNNQKRKNPDTRIPLSISLADVYNGKTMKVEVKNQKICNHCRGTGADSPDKISTCTKCDGSGHILSRHQIAPGMYQQVQRPCSKCNGAGKIIKKKCHVCGGHKVSTGSAFEHVEIEKGMEDGYEIVLNRAGDQGPDYLPGDIIFSVSVVPHSTFKRVGNHLYSSITLNLGEALFGFTKTIKHLDGHEVEISRDKISQPGQVITLSKEGMPIHDYPSEHGNMYVTLNVVLPKKLDASQLSKFKDALGA